MDQQLHLRVATTLHQHKEDAEVSVDVVVMDEDMDIVVQEGVAAVKEQIPRVDKPMKR